MCTGVPMLNRSGVKQISLTRSGVRARVATVQGRLWMDVSNMDVLVSGGGCSPLRGRDCSVPLAFNLFGQRGLRSVPVGSDAAGRGDVPVRSLLRTNVITAQTFEIWVDGARYCAPRDLAAR